MLKNKNLIFGIFLSLILLTSCISKKKDNSEPKIIQVKSEIDVSKENNINYKSKFAGGYTIEVEGVSSAQEVELYALNENGGAIWMWIENDGNDGAIIEDEKSGTWSATENSITIDIRGNSGMISETYKLKGNLLTNTQLTKRYLKKTE